MVAYEGTFPGSGCTYRANGRLKGFIGLLIATFLLETLPFQVAFEQLF